jgi:hypothetical protein
MAQIWMEVCMDRTAMLKTAEAAVKGGSVVVSADNSVVVTMVQEALQAGRSVTFFTSPEQATAVMSWFWTPRRIKEVGMQLVSKEEMAKIDYELGIKSQGTWFSNRVACENCGHVYGMFEFIQQGIAEHGRDFVDATLDLKNTSVIRVNPQSKSICPNCKVMSGTSHWYDMRGPLGDATYGCCRVE